MKTKKETNIIYIVTREEQGGLVMLPAVFFPFSARKYVCECEGAHFASHFFFLDSADEGGGL
jgi:hypothetical protein